VKGVAKSGEAERPEAAPTLEPSIGFFDPNEPVANLAGHLPHWRQEGVTYFVTFRCADALPQSKLRQWKEDLRVWLDCHPEPHDVATRREFFRLFPKRIQDWLDAGYGSCPFRDPNHCQAVENALRHFNGERYYLDEFVVAMNHVHVLLTPLGEHSLSSILHSWKSFTAHQIHLPGSRVRLWQKESFDHIVRSPASLERFRQYIREHSQSGSKSKSGSGQGGGGVPPPEQPEAAPTLTLKRNRA